MKKDDSKYVVCLDDDAVMHLILEEFVSMPVKAFESAEVLLKQAKHLSPAAAFVDVHLGMASSGIDLLPELRKYWPDAVLIVMTTDNADEVAAQALGAGANDFVRKPFSQLEILARLHARLADMDQRTGSFVELGACRLNLVTRQFSGPKGQTILTPSDCTALQLFTKRQGEVIQNSELKAALWPNVVISDNAVQKRIHDVRRVLDEVGSSHNIENVYGSGFALVERGKQPKLPVRGKSKSRVLVVDDDDVGRRLIVRMLEQLGLSPIEVPDGDACLTEIQQSEFDLVVLDMTMPGISGVDLAKRIRSACPDIKILSVSGVTLNFGKEAGEWVDAFLAKPFSFQQFDEALTRLLGNKKKKSEQTSPPSSESPLDALARENRGALIQEIIKLFEEQTPALLEDLKKALSAANAPRVFELAHKLKGRVGSLGLSNLVELCARLERGGRDGMLVDSQALYEKIVEGYNTALGTLSKYTKKAA